MNKLKEIETNMDEELRKWLKLAKQQKEKIDNNYLIQQTLRHIEKDFKSYFKTLEEYHKHPEKFTRKPNPPKPKKLKNLDHFTIEFNTNTIKQEGKN